MRPSTTLATFTVVVLACAPLAIAEGTPPASPPAPAKTPAALAADLASEDLAVRRAAVYGLWQARRDAKPFLPAVAEALRDDDDYVRTTADKILATYRAESVPDGLEASVDALVECLKDPRAEVRRLAIANLWRAGWPTSGAPHPGLVPAVVRALDDPDPAVRASAAAVLVFRAVDAAPAVPALLRNAKSPDEDVRIWSVSALASVDRRAGLDVFVASLADAAPKVRAAAATALGFPLPANRKAVPALVKALADADPTVRDAAAGAFVGFSGDVAAPEAVAPLVAMLDDESPTLRASAAAALGQVGDRHAIEGLLHRASDDVDANVRAAAVQALGGIGPDGLPALDRLVAWLDDPDDGVAVAAARAIESFGPLARAAEPALRKATGAKSANLRAAAASALGALGDVSVESVQAIATLLDPSDGMVFSNAAGALRRLGPESAPAAAALAASLSAKPELGVDYALPALASLGTGARGVVPTVRAFVATTTRARVGRAHVLGRAPASPGDLDAAVRELTTVVEDEADADSYLAAYALGELGAAARPARAALALRLVDADPNARGVFASALLAIDPTTAGFAWEACAAAARDGLEPGLDAMVRAAPVRGVAAVNVLRDALRSDHGWARAGAVAAFARLSPLPGDAKAVFEKALADPSPRVRMAAATAQAKLAAKPR